MKSKWFVLATSRVHLDKKNRRYICLGGDIWDKVYHNRNFCRCQIFSVTQFYRLLFKTHAKQCKYCDLVEIFWNLLVKYQTKVEYYQQYTYF